MPAPKHGHGCKYTPLTHIQIHVVRSHTHAHSHGPALPQHHDHSPNALSSKPPCFPASTLSKPPIYCRISISVYLSGKEIKRSTSNTKNMYRNLLGNFAAPPGAGGRQGIRGGFPFLKFGDGHAARANPMEEGNSVREGRGEDLNRV